jgi:hypothetical protein
MRKENGRARAASDRCLCRYRRPCRCVRTDYRDRHPMEWSQLPAERLLAIIISPCVSGVKYNLPRSVMIFQPQAFAGVFCTIRTVSSFLEKTGRRTGWRIRRYVLTDDLHTNSPLLSSHVSILRRRRRPTSYKATKKPDDDHVIRLASVGTCSVRSRFTRGPAPPASPRGAVCSSRGSSCACGCSSV